MKKSISLFLILSILALSGGLFANDKKYEFSLVRKKTELPKEKLEFVTLKRDFLLSYDQTLLITPPGYEMENLNILRSDDFWKGAKIGALVGGLGTLLIVAALGFEEEEDDFLSLKPTPGEAVLFVGGGVVLGGLIGGLIATILRNFSDLI